MHDVFLMQNQSRIDRYTELDVSKIGFSNSSYLNVHIFFDFSF